MEKLTKKRLLEALAKTILAGATFHLFLLVLYFLKTNDYRIINIFNILDIDLFYPQMSEGLPNFLLSFIFIGIVYFTILVAFTKKRNRS